MRAFAFLSAPSAPQARCKLSGEVVALKVYKLAEQGDIQRMQLYREIKLHAALRHSNIIQYYACFLVGVVLHGALLVGEALCVDLRHSNIIQYYACLLVGGGAAAGTHQHMTRQVLMLPGGWCGNLWALGHGCRGALQLARAHLKQNSRAYRTEANCQ